MSQVTDTLLAAAQARREQSIQFLQQLIAAQRDGEAAVQHLFAEHLRAAGCEVESLHYAPRDVQMRQEFAAGDVSALKSVTEVDLTHRDGHVIHAEVVTHCLLDEHG